MASSHKGKGIWVADLLSTLVFPSDIGISFPSEYEVCQCIKY